MNARLEIIRCGPLMTVQDGGRYGHRAFGVSTSGAVDRESHAIANALVGNSRGAAALEFALAGGAIRADRDVLVAVTGGACRIEIDGEPVVAWESHVLRAGQIFSVAPLPGAVWYYLAVSGGIATEPVLGSRSTHLRTGLGGLAGKALTPGDELPLGETASLAPLALSQPWLRRPGPILVVPGPQDDYFDAGTWKRLQSELFQVSAARDRMAMMLDGPALKAAKGHDIVSDATVTGSIQVPGSGRPIVLTADGQTTGGYPKIATVASFDLGRLVQLPSGSPLHFRVISADAAETLSIKAQDRLDQLLGSLCASPGAT